MEMMTARWTDDRMDDLKNQVDTLGHRLENGFAEQRREMNARFDRLEKGLEVRFDKVDERFGEVEARFDKRFDGIDKRFDGINKRFEGVDKRFEKVDAKFDAIQDQIARTHETVVGLYAMLARFSLWFAGAVAVAVVGALLTLWLH